MKEFKLSYRPVNNVLKTFTYKDGYGKIEMLFTSGCKFFRFSTGTPSSFGSGYDFKFKTAEQKIQFENALANDDLRTAYKISQEIFPSDAMEETIYNPKTDNAKHWLNNCGVSDFLRGYMECKKLQSKPTFLDKIGIHVKHKEMVHREVHEVVAGNVLRN